MRCKGCKYVSYVWDREARSGWHICNLFKYKGDLVFRNASGAYRIGCNGKYKSQKDDLHRH